MALFSWDQRYAIDIGEIDEQHRRLFHLIGVVHEYSVAGADREQMGRIILELVAYVHTHFSYEEELLIRSRYPAFEQHKAIHVWFTQHVNALDVKFRQGQTALGPEMLVFLNDWLLQHILGTDKQYMPHVKAYLARPEK